MSSSDAAVDLVARLRRRGPVRPAPALDQRVDPETEADPGHGCPPISPRRASRSTSPRSLRASTTHVEPHELVTRSPAQYWEMISEHVSLAVAALQQVDEPARERIAKAVIAKVSTYEKDGKVRIPGVARCIVGTK